MFTWLKNWWHGEQPTPVNEVAIVNSAPPPSFELSPFEKRIQAGDSIGQWSGDSETAVGTGSLGALAAAELRSEGRVPEKEPPPSTAYMYRGGERVIVPRIPVGPRTAAVKPPVEAPKKRTSIAAKKRNKKQPKRSKR